MRSSCPISILFFGIGGIVACSGGDGGDQVDPTAVDGTMPVAAAANDGAPPAPLGEGIDGGAPTDGGSIHDGAKIDAAKPDTGPACKKHLTVVFAVGTGAGAVASHSNGCWTVVDADGAANPQFRKCSTGKLVVENAGAPNYAFDDTNPDTALSSDQGFLSQCAAGATGEGFEYMANRGGWRLLTAPKMKAYFAELYSTDQTVDDYYSLWQQTISGHTVYPMINIGPNDAPTIKSASLTMCNRVADMGYFGVYNGAYRVGMTPSDVRALALASSLNTCTQ